MILSKRQPVKAPEPGIYPNLTRAEYDAIDAINASLLKQAGRSMAHAKAYLDGHRKTSEALAFGAAYHAYVLERERFDREYVVIPKVNRTTKEGKAAWEAAVEKAGDNPDLVIWLEDVATFEAMRAALQDTECRRTLCNAPGEYETCIVWDDHGTLCKALVDKVIHSRTVLMDLKKADNALPHKFERAAVEYGYFLQAAFYMDGAKAVTGKDFDFVFLVQEDDAPYASAMYAITWGSQEHLWGRKQCQDLIASVCTCKRTGVWPGYGDDPIDLRLPAWVKDAV